MTLGEYFDENAWSWFDQMCFVRNLCLKIGQSPEINIPRLEAYRRQKIPEKYVYNKDTHKFENVNLRKIDDMKELRYDC